ncbi:sulfurtransferase TusA family protein [Salinivibrio sp. ES.052]|uniref:sulfurtransferase TusA family protein n=1 Tax=Salinivibrio sp. ES.052 TaxID=1882823 RepID=UPI0009265096|nr:sulfurtransferase TusA family protein [Salinivibrio sp. ES.052]SIN98876.1 Sulfurtransferase TusA [Salinivibrio sp. ES.052]
MECQTLDLREHVCPMALILAKRAAASLREGEQLVVLLGDQGAKDDIPKYFTREGFTIAWLDTPASRLHVTK